MNTLSGILLQLKRERDRVQQELRQLDQAIAALGGFAGGNKSASKGNVRMSLAARKRIAAAQRARWAKFHAAQKKAA